MGESSSTVVVDNKLAANKLAANKLAANKLAANKLTAINAASATELIETDDGRELLAFIVSCALAEGTTLVSEDSLGNTYEFFGEVGLADHWLTSPIDQAGAGWVSACLFARVNASNVPLPISLRGSSPILATDEGERAGWPIQEGGFYGNFFTDGEAIDWNACRGEDQAAGEGGGLEERDCAEPCTVGELLLTDDPSTATIEPDIFCEANMTQCGFHYAGDCGSFTEDYACRRYSEKGTFYMNCLDEPGFTTKPNGNSTKYKGDSESYRQVITVYVQ